MNDLSGKRWNELIDAANNNLLPSEVYPPLSNNKEISIYNDMLKELYEIRKINPKACFSPIEIEYDDPVLDIYKDDVGGNKKR